MTRDSISRDAYNNPANGWAQHRSFSTADAARWYIDRLPDTDDTEYRLVDHPTRFLIASRERFAHRN